MLEKLDVPPLRLIAFNILTLTSPLWSTLKSALSGTNIGGKTKSTTSYLMGETA